MDFSPRSSPGSFTYFSCDFVVHDWETLYLPVPFPSCCFRSKVWYILHIFILLYRETVSSSPVVGKIPMTKTVHRKNITSVLALLSKLLPYVNHCARHMGRGERMEQKTWFLFPRSPGEAINVYLLCSTLEMETQWEI